MSETTCYACETTCPNWGSQFRNFCQPCANGIYKLITGDPLAEMPNTNGWTSSQDAHINQWIASLNRKIPCPVIIPKEFPCHQCQKLNDVGVKVCWWCETDNPITV